MTDKVLLLGNGGTRNTTRLIINKARGCLVENACSKIPCTCGTSEQSNGSKRRRAVVAFRCSFCDVPV